MTAFRSCQSSPLIGLKYLYLLTFILLSAASYGQTSVDHAFKQIQETRDGKVITLHRWYLFDWLDMQALSKPTMEIIEKNIEIISFANTKLDSSRYNTFKILDNYCSDFADIDHFKDFFSFTFLKYKNRIMIRVEKNIVKDAVFLATDGESLNGVHIKSKIPLAKFKDIFSNEILGLIKKLNPSYKSF